MPEEPNQEVEARRFPSFASPPKNFNLPQGSGWLYYFYLTPLAHLTSVGDSFLGGCSGLAALDLTLEHLTIVGDSFLGGCPGLTALDFTPLAHLTNVGNLFLYMCDGWWQRPVLPSLYVRESRGTSESRCKSTIVRSLHWGKTCMDVYPWPRIGEEHDE